MTNISQTNRLLTDLGSRVAEKLGSLGFPICKVMVTHAGAGELECCECDGGTKDDCYAVTVWEERSYPSAFPPLPVEPEPSSSAWVDVHEVHLTIATCWPSFDRAVPKTDDPREVTALGLAKVRDVLAEWLSSCAANTENLLPRGNLHVSLRGIRADRAVDAAAGIECRGWELTILCW